MTSYITRTAEETLLKYLSAFPVVGLTGPRQSGKSTLLNNLLKDKYKNPSKHFD
jgi:predicted AAA+ superfamily ATPase